MNIIYKNLKFLLFLSIFLFVSRIGVSQSISKLDSILAIAKKMPDDSLKVDTLNKIAWKYLIYGKLQLAFAQSKEILTLADKLKYVRGKAYATKTLGAIYYYSGRQDTAYTYYKSSLLYFQKSTDKEGTAKAYHNVGMIYEVKGNFKRALKNYLKSLELKVEINDKKGIAAEYEAIGSIYISAHKNVEDSKKALDYLQKALKIYKESKNQYGIASVSIKLANLYYNYKLTEKEYTESVKQSNLNIAKGHAEHALEISKENNYLRFIAASSDLLGNIYLTNKSQKSIVYFEASLKIRKQLGNVFGVVGSLMSIGTYYMNSGNLIKAKENYLEALKIADKQKFLDMKREALFVLADISEKLKNYKEATTYYREHQILFKELNSKDNTAKLTQMAMQYEFDQKEKLQEVQKQKEKAIYDANIKRQRVIIGFVIIGLVMVLIFAAYMYKSFRDKKKANLLLEDKNNEISNKNVRLNQQKEEIEAQRDEIEQHRDFVVKQKDEIEKQNKHITDSIVYAQRIQQAILPPPEFLDKVLLEYFVLFKPRDIVSGDFYWSSKKDNKVILVAADCTGHGVPGAFMSLLGMTFLNEIVNKMHNDTGDIIANEILNELRNTVKSSLRQTGKFQETKDGMDMSLVVIDTETRQMQYSGAYNSLLLVRDNEMITLKADRMPVGIHFKDKKSFSNQNVDMKKDDIAYIFSDGYVDQFGGPKGRKFMMKRFQELILENYKKSMSEQKLIFDDAIESWKGHIKSDGSNYKQIDDILVIAFKV